MSDRELRSLGNPAVIEAAKGSRRRLRSGTVRASTPIPPDSPSAQRIYQELSRISFNLTDSDESQVSHSTITQNTMSINPNNVNQPNQNRQNEDVDEEVDPFEDEARGLEENAQPTLANIMTSLQKMSRDINETLRAVHNLEERVKDLEHFKEDMQQQDQDEEEPDPNQRRPVDRWPHLRQDSQTFSHQQLATAIANAFKNVKISSVQTNIKIPKFHPQFMTADNYLTELERYFDATQQHKNYLSVVSSVLDPEHRNWFMHMQNKIKSWAQFKTEFIARYDGWYQSSRRLSELKSRQQTLNHSTERFIYDMVQLSKSCFPHETDEAYHVKHAQAALHPRLRVALGATLHDSVLDLIQACEITTANLLATDELANIKNQVPPMYEHEKRKNNNEQKTSEKSDNQQQARASKSDSQLHQNNRGKGRGQHRGRGFFSRSQSRSSSPNRVQQEETSANTSKSANRGNYHRQTDNRNSYRPSTHNNETPSSKPEICAKCGGRGHSPTNCPSKFGLATCVWTNGKWVLKEFVGDSKNAAKYDDDDDESNYSGEN